MRTAGPSGLSTSTKPSRFARPSIRRIGRKDIALHALEPAGPSGVDQLREQAAREPQALPIVDHGECELAILASRRCGIACPGNDFFLCALTRDRHQLQLAARHGPRCPDRASGETARATGT